jgi:hypothetical protein
MTSSSLLSSGLNSLKGLGLGSIRNGLELGVETDFDLDDQAQPTIVKTRQELRQHVDVIRMLTTYFRTGYIDSKDNTVSPPITNKNLISHKVNKAGYIQLHMAIAKALFPIFDEVEAKQLAEKDWQRDSKGRPDLDRKSHNDAVFELAEMSSLSSAAYVRFLQVVYHRITKLVPINQQARDALLTSARGASARKSAEREKKDNKSSKFKFLTMKPTKSSNGSTRGSKQPSTQGSQSTTPTSSHAPASAIAWFQADATVRGFKQLNEIEMIPPEVLEELSEEMCGAIEEQKNVFNPTKSAAISTPGSAHTRHASAALNPSPSPRPIIIRQSSVGVEKKDKNPTAAITVQHSGVNTPTRALSPQPPHETNNSAMNSPSYASNSTSAVSAATISPSNSNIQPTPPPARKSGAIAMIINSGKTAKLQQAVANGTASTANPSNGNINGAISPSTAASPTVAPQVTSTNADDPPVPIHTITVTPHPNTGNSVSIKVTPSDKAATHTASPESTAVSQAPEVTGYVCCICDESTAIVYCGSCSMHLCAVDNEHLHKPVKKQGHLRVSINCSNNDISSSNSNSMSIAITKSEACPAETTPSNSANYPGSLGSSINSTHDLSLPNLSHPSSPILILKPAIRPAAPEANLHHINSNSSIAATISPINANSVTPTPPLHPAVSPVVFARHISIKRAESVSKSQPLSNSSPPNESTESAASSSLDNSMNSPIIIHPPASSGAATPTAFNSPALSAQHSNISPALISSALSSPRGSSLHGRRPSSMFANLMGVQRRTSFAQKDVSGSEDIMANNTNATNNHSNSVVSPTPPAPRFLVDSFPVSPPTLNSRNSSPPSTADAYSAELTRSYKGRSSVTNSLALPGMNSCGQNNNDYGNMSHAAEQADLADLAFRRMHKLRTMSDASFAQMTPDMAGALGVSSGRNRARSGQSMFPPIETNAHHINNASISSTATNNSDSF